MAVGYDVFVDTDLQGLTDIALLVAMKWIAFALGTTSLHGHRVQHPTGRLASSIRVEGRSATQVAIVSDESFAPEALWLELGHQAIDLKRTSLAGRVVPLHRGRPGQYGSAGYGPAVYNPTLAGRTRNVWAAPRAQGATGFRRVPSRITAENASRWIIPAMPAWSPAMYLAYMIRGGEFDGA